MEHHGSESYFVIGEGLLGESVGGRERTLGRAVEAVAPPFRFSRMGPNGSGHQLGDPNRKRIATAMTAGGGGASRIPSGFTYLGQFTDHDLTFDKTSAMLGEHVSPTQLLQARSPSLDLDSLYGAGPGVRIVAETFHRAMEGSQVSIVRDPTWRPSLGPNNTTFRMVDLLLFAFEGKKALLAPLG
jgi:hypothetical protein